MSSYMQTCAVCDRQLHPKMECICPERQPDLTWVTES